MDVLTYVLLLLFSFLGLIIGIFISKMTIEEITRASRYLKYLNILLVPLIFLIASYNINSLYSIIFSSIVLITLIVFKNKYNDAWTYACMGAALYISTISQESLNVSVLIFVYGISVATIDASAHYKKKINGEIKLTEKTMLVKKILSKYTYYLLVGILFFVVFSYVL